MRLSSKKGQNDNKNTTSNLKRRKHQNHNTTQKKINMITMHAVPSSPEEGGQAVMSSTVLGLESTWKASSPTIWGDFGVACGAAPMGPIRAYIISLMESQ